MLRLFRRSVRAAVRAESRFYRVPFGGVEVGAIHESDSAGLVEAVAAGNVLEVGSVRLWRGEDGAFLVRSPFGTEFLGTDVQAAVGRFLAVDGQMSAHAVA